MYVGFFYWQPLDLERTRYEIMSLYGRDGFRETRGFPTTAKIPPQAEDVSVAARLWTVSESLTGVSFT